MLLLMVLFLLKFAEFSASVVFRLVFVFSAIRRRRPIWSSPA